MHNMSTYISGT